MKYLKKFESNNSYYVSITQDEYYKSASYSPPTRLEKRMLNSLFRKETRFSFDSFEMGKPHFIVLSHSIEGRKSKYIIDKVPDEYYIVIRILMVDNWPIREYYKCDQLEGLIQYLRNEKVII